MHGETVTTNVKKSIRGKKDPREKVKRYFLAANAKSVENQRLKKIAAKVPVAIKPAASAFVANVAGAVSTICIPFTMALSSTQRWRYNQLYIAERIRITDEEFGAKKAEAEARSRAEKRIADEVKSKDAIEKLGLALCDFLLHMHSNPEVVEASAELLRQGAVLIWGALETLARDIFESTINAKPLLAKRVLDSPECRKLFQIKAIDFDTLAKFNFDVSGRIGSILVQLHDLSNLPAIKVIFGALSPSSSKLRSALSSKNLWILNQRRHLIVHNRSIVDQRYIENTGERLRLGQKLLLEPKDLLGYISLVQEVGAEILETTNNIWKTST